MASDGDQVANGRMEAAQAWRRVRLTHEPQRRLGPLLIEPAMRRIRHDDGREEIVEPRVMQVLVAMLRADGAILSRDDLIELCWDGRIVGDDAIHRVLSRLRRVAEGIADGVFRVETVTKVGHRIVCSEAVAAAPAASGGGAPPAIPSYRKLRSSGGRPFGYAAAIVMIVAAAALYLVTTAKVSPGQPREASIAVLPFASLSAGEENSWFAEGVAEEIMGLLAEQPHLRVAGRTSAAMLGPDAGFREAKERLGVSHLLEGSVRRQGDRVRVTVRLLQTSDGMQVWSQAFERRLGDIFAVQDEIGAAVAARLQGTLAAAQLPRTRSRTSPEVYDLYLAANSLAHRRTYEAMLEAKRLLQRAIAIDPNYAPAHARLGFYMQVIDQLRPSGAYQASAEEEQQSRRHIERALALAPTLAEAHAAMGMLTWKSDPEQALVHHGRALELDPDNYLAWNSGGNVHRDLCRPAMAIASYRRAASIEPLLRTPYINLVDTLAEIGRHDEAEEVVRNYMTVAREAKDGHRMMATLALHRGDLSGAVVHGRAAIRSGADDPSTATQAALALHALGRTEEAARLLPHSDRGTIGAYWSGRAAPLAGSARNPAMWLPHSHTAAISRAMLVAGQERRLLRLWGAHFGTLQRFDARYGCSLPQHSVPIILALRRAGRTDLSERLLGMAERRLRQARAAGYGHVGASAAMLRMLRGDHDGALDYLERALDGGWIGQGDPDALADPVFEQIRSHPRFIAVKRRMAAERLREQRELAAETARLPTAASVHAREPIRSEASLPPSLERGRGRAPALVLG